MEEGSLSRAWRLQDGSSPAVVLNPSLENDATFLSFPGRDRGSKSRHVYAIDSRPPRGMDRPAPVGISFGGIAMAVARGDEGSTNITNNPGPGGLRRRIVRKPVATPAASDNLAPPPPA